jgi:hypothetical protein
MFESTVYGDNSHSVTVRVESSYTLRLPFYFDRSKNTTYSPSRADHLTILHLAF